VIFLEGFNFSYKIIEDVRSFSIDFLLFSQKTYSQKEMDCIPNS